MFRRYNKNTIYLVYLLDKEKIIYIKDLKIVKNANRKVNSQITFYNIITVS